jgi:hypothetical protein
MFSKGQWLWRRVTRQLWSRVVLFSLLAVLVALAAAFVPRRSFDVFALSAVALGLNTLAVAGLGRLLFENAHGDPIGRLFLLGALAAGMLAASVNGVLRLARAHAAAEGATA